jgi:ubiquinone/menaquinone biosynthesis C-methylase UbiE
MHTYDQRQAEMESWYEALLESGEEDARREVLRDYQPHAEVLASLRGRVLDLGGGAGLAAAFLRPDVEHVVVDPSPIWSSDRWKQLAEMSRANGPSPQFLAAPGEEIPCPDGSFDAAVSFWALNHVRDPQRCIQELVRLLRPGGRAYLVLEDMPPSWAELLRDTVGRIAARLTSRPRRADVQLPLSQAVAAKLTAAWPLQSDHVRITDGELRGWTRGHLRLQRRAWTGGYRTYDLTRV